MRAFLARLLRSLTSTTLSAQLAGMLIGGILFLHGVATFTVQLVEERQAARSALLEQANSLALSLQLLHSEPFEYKRSLLERLERLDVVHLSLSDAPNPARQARDERALYLRDRLRKNLNSIETDLDTREMLTEVQRVHVADSMNPTLRRHVPWTHVYESRVSVRLDDGKWLCVVISSDAYDFSPSQASLTMLLLEAGLLILLILVVVHRVVRPNSFRRCLSNLLDNALRYSGSVRIQLREKDDILQIDVLDDGPGIPPDMLEQVFEPFFRLDEARSPHTGGSGLGLSIARSMACRNGGELSLHNRPEGGLCARLCLYRSAMETETL